VKYRSVRNQHSNNSSESDIERMRSIAIRCSQFANSRSPLLIKHDLSQSEKAPPRLSYIFLYSTEIPNASIRGSRTRKERDSRANGKRTPMSPRCKARFHPRSTVGSERRSGTQDRAKLQSQVIIISKKEEARTRSRGQLGLHLRFAWPRACVRKWRAHERRALATWSWWYKSQGREVERKSGMSVGG
jgi:hypothetical protein